MACATCGKVHLRDVHVYTITAAVIMGNGDAAYQLTRNYVSMLRNVAAIAVPYDNAIQRRLRDALNKEDR